MAGRCGFQVATRLPAFWCSQVLPKCLVMHSSCRVCRFLEVSDRCCNILQCVVTCWVVAVVVLWPCHGSTGTHAVLSLTGIEKNPLKLGGEQISLCPTYGIGVVCWVCFVQHTADFDLGCADRLNPFCLLKTQPWVVHPGLPTSKGT